jgi:hypothetical protein
MSDLTPEIINLTLEECHLAFNDTGERARGYEWVLEELCRIALTQCARNDSLSEEWHAAARRSVRKPYKDLEAERDKLKEEVERLNEMLVSSAEHGMRERHALRRERDKRAALSRTSEEA